MCVKILSVFFFGGGELFKNLASRDNNTPSAPEVARAAHISQLV